MWLPWKDAALLAAVVAAIAWSARGWLRATAQELALVLGLYALWQFAGAVASGERHGAVNNARALVHVERWLHLPSELAVQHQAMHHPLLVQALNGYYAIAHVPAIIAVLIWLFVRHRERYSWVRNTLALVTAWCLLLHFIPMAPPRLVPGLGFIDTGLEYGQSGYGPATAHGLSDQVAAIPSMHVAWALLVALGALYASRSRWRWLVLAHPVVTVWAITATGNHWWLDGVAAAALLPPAIWAQDRGIALVRRSVVVEAQRLGDRPLDIALEQEPRPDEFVGGVANGSFVQVAIRHGASGLERQTATDELVQHIGETIDRPARVPAGIRRDGHGDRR